MSKFATFRTRKGSVVTKPSVEEETANTRLEAAALFGATAVAHLAALHVVKSAVWGIFGAAESPR